MLLGKCNQQTGTKHLKQVNCIPSHVHIFSESITQRKNVDDTSSSLKDLYTSKIQVLNEHVFKYNTHYLKRHDCGFKA